MTPTVTTEGLIGVALLALFAGLTFGFSCGFFCGRIRPRNRLNFDPTHDAENLGIGA
jgi:membrane protein DedA with SNARE-associated domain